jgi:hypothetical protein
MKGIVIIPCRGPLDSGEHLLKTLEHVFYPAPLLDHEIVIVDDNPTALVDPESLTKRFSNLHVVHTSGGIGCAGSRDFGVSHSPVELHDDDILIFLDAHMNPNLYQDIYPGNFIDKIARHLEKNRTRILCGKCYALDGSTWYAYGNGKKACAGYGATIEFHGPKEIFEPRWIDTRPPNLPPFCNKLTRDPLAYRVPIIHGACYAMTVSVFRYLEGFSGLEEWGSDEVYLCLKAYIADRHTYQCGVMEDTRVGHLFEPSGRHPERRLPLTFNKFRVIRELFPSHLVEPYIELVRLKELEGKDAYAKYLEKEPEIAQRRLHWIEKFSEKNIETWFKAFEREFETPASKKLKNATPFLKKFSNAAHKPSEMKSLYESTPQFGGVPKMKAASTTPQNTTPWPICP